MNILYELNLLLNKLGVPVETGIFSNEAPNEYLVITPLSDTFVLYGDNMPLNESQEARISLYSKNNYQKCKNQIVQTLLNAGFTITERRYIGYEYDNAYHHYVVDVLKNYFLEGID